MSEYEETSYSVKTVLKNSRGDGLVVPEDHRFSLGDIVEVMGPNENGIYTVTDVSGGTLTLDRPIEEGGDPLAVKKREDIGEAFHMGDFGPFYHEMWRPDHLGLLM